MAQPSQDDLTPVSGSATDVAALGRSTPPPTHELPGGEGMDTALWNAIAETEEFKQLLAAKLRFIVPGTIFFMVYFLLLPVLVGYRPSLMKKEVWGPVNVAYLFGLSQFFMSWILAGIYVKVAAGWDRLSAALVDRQMATR